MKEMYSNIAQLAQQCPDITLSIKAGELIEAVEYCIQKTRKELEQQITDAAAETYPSRHKVSELLDVDLSTLHRWNKNGYLVSIEVGGKRRYRMSDVKRILNAKKKQKIDN
jgi:DNA-binding transcriptional MerR regulator